MPKQSMSSNDQVAMFAKLAEQYCHLIDTHEDISKLEFIKKAAILLAKLFAAGAELTELPMDLSKGKNPDSSIEDAHNDWQTNFDSLQKKWGKDDQYWMVFNSYIEKAPLCNSLSDDLADIYTDMKRGLNVFGRSEKDNRNSAFTWKFHFLAHWGKHCACALRAINQLMQREGLEDDL